MNRKAEKKLQIEAKAIDCKIIRQVHYQESVIIDGQEVALPYTNGICWAILEKTDQGWRYCHRAGDDADAEERINDVLKIIRRVRAMRRIRNRKNQDPFAFERI